MDDAFKEVTGKNILAMKKEREC